MHRDGATRPFRGAFGPRFLSLRTRTDCGDHCERRRAPCQLADGRQLSCHRFWLRENTLGHGGIDPATREGIMDPADLSEAILIDAFELTESGDLRVTWAPEGAEERVVSTYHSGWLKHIAEGQHLPGSWVPAPNSRVSAALLRCV